MIRNPDLITQRAKRVEASRINGATKEVIAEFYKRLEIPEIKAIPPKYRYNKDEMGLQEGQRINSMIIRCAEYIQFSNLLLPLKSESSTRENHSTELW